MAISLLFLFFVVVIVVLAIRRVGGSDAAGPTDAHAVRRFFQYLVLYGLLVVVAIGLSGLLDRLLDRDVLVSADPAQLARDLAFTVVGLPLFAGVAWWSRRRLAGDSAEARSLGWAFYVTAASLTALVMAMTGLHQVLRWAVGADSYSSRGLTALLVWGAAWAAHLWVDARITPRQHSRVHHLVGSLIGLVTAAVGLVGLLAAALRSLLGLEGDALVAVGPSPMLGGLVTLLVGAPVWFIYWARTAARRERDPLWLAYVLLAGVAGGLVTAIAAASTLVYSLLVWLLGDPRSTDAATYFHRAPTAAAAAVVGLLVWWYHRAVLGEAGTEERTEVRRIFDYLMAAIGLLAAAGGLTTLLVAFLEAVTRSAHVFVDTSAVNTLLAAATLLAVGAPVWWLSWRRIQAAARETPSDELASPTRRVYLFALFGVGGVVAVIAVLIGVYLLFEDLVTGTAGAETLRRMRFAIGVLVTTAAIASYHWAIYRTDREHTPDLTEGQGPRFVLLIGPADPAIAQAVAARTHARVHAWARTDDGLATWSVDEVLASLAGTSADEVMVLADDGGLRAIPIHRG